MILKFRSRLGHIVEHEITANARNWLLTTKVPRIEFWVNAAKDVYLIAGTNRWTPRRRKWVEGPLHFDRPVNYLGNDAVVQFDGIAECLALDKLVTYHRLPYSDQTVGVKQL